MEKVELSKSALLQITEGSSFAVVPIMPSSVPPASFVQGLGSTAASVEGGALSSPKLNLVLERANQTLEDLLLIFFCLFLRGPVSHQ